VPDVLLATDADWIHDEVDAVFGDDETTVVRVRTGYEVLKVVRDVEPGLVVLDLQIGNMGGIATAIAVQQEYEGDEDARPPILLLLDRPADVPLARRVGVEGWLVKPLDAFRLRRAARALAAGDPFHEPSGLATL
jgi:DNA-binding response OmpR family regulator